MATFTNYGNKYKFAAIIKRRSQNAEKNKVLVQCLRKNGTWGKPIAHKRFGRETDEDVVKRLSELNPQYVFRLAEA